MVFSKTPKDKNCIDNINTTITKGLIKYFKPMKEEKRTNNENDNINIDTRI